MPAFELIGGYATAPDTTETTLTAMANNSFTVRSTAENNKVKLCSMWAKVQGVGIFKVRSPRMHDNVQGIRFRTLAANNVPLLPYFPNQELFPQDTLIPSLSGSATSGDIELGFFLLHYDDLKGSNQNLITSDEVKGRIKNIMTVENSITGGTAGTWAGQVALNATFDLMKANTNYALLGYTSNLIGGAVRYSGSDFGNLGFGGPCNATYHDLTRQWFMDLSDKMGVPAIPVVNSANKANTLVDIACDENGGTFVINSIFAELSN